MSNTPMVIAKPAQKVLWAIDAFPESPTLQAEVARALAAYTAFGNIAVYPVYVTRSEPFVGGSDTSGASYEEVTRKSLQRFLSHFAIRVRGLCEPQVLSVDAYSLRTAVKSLIEFAKKGNFDLIAVGTHARSGVPRLFLGSFAETLILESEVPVLVVNPHAVSHFKIRNLFFACDLNEGSRNAFEKTVQLAKTLNARVLFFHQISFFPAQSYYPFLLASVPIPSPEEIKAEVKEKSKSLMDSAKTHGVDVRLAMSSAQGDVAQTIVKAAAKLNNTVIVMAPQTGRAGAMLLGSTTRRVMRSAACPVLVLPRSRPNSKERLTPKRDLTVGKAMVS